MFLPHTKVTLALALLMGSGSLQATEWKISTDLRERYQSFQNFDFNSANNKDTWEFDSRLYVSVKGKFDNGLSVHVQPQAIYTLFNDPLNGKTNLSQFDLFQAYVGYQMGNVALKLGRQTLVYGDQRLLGHLGWKDVARTFDGGKVMYKNDALSVDAFVVHPANIVAMTPSAAKPKGKSLTTWDQRTLTGVYATYKTAPKTGMDAYFINWSHSQQAAVAPGRDVNTYGTRAFGKTNGMDATAEAVFQSGTWKSGVSQSAAAYAVKAGYTLDAWQTRLGIEYDYSPGDDNTNATTHKNFVFPFHTNHAHYGEMDRFSWANMKDIRLSLKTVPTKGLTLLANVHYLSLDKAQGDWLNVVGAGALYKGAANYTQTEAGTEVDLKAVYKVASVKGLKLVCLYGQFNPGAAVKERTGNADKATFAYMIAQYKF